MSITCNQNFDFHEILPTANLLYDFIFKKSSEIPTDQGFITIAVIFNENLGQKEIDQRSNIRTTESLITTLSTNILKSSSFITKENNIKGIQITTSEKLPDIFTFNQ